VRQVPSALLLAQAMGSAGVESFFGREFGPLPVIAASEEAAELLARAHLKVNNTRAAIHLGVESSVCRRSRV